MRTDTAGTKLEELWPFPDARDEVLDAGRRGGDEHSSRLPGTATRRTATTDGDSRGSSRGAAATPRATLAIMGRTEGERSREGSSLLSAGGNKRWRGEDVETHDRGHKWEREWDGKEVSGD